MLREFGWIAALGYTNLTGSYTLQISISQSWIAG
jgi:hypothetical protein